MEPLPDLGSLSDEELKSLIDELEHAGARGQLPAPPAPRQDRHPARRARRAAAEVGRPERARPGRRRPADRDPHGEGARRPPDGGRLLQRVRVPEPGVRELLLALRRAAREGRAVASETTQTFAPEDVGELVEHDDFGPRGPGARRPRGRRQGGGELPARRASARASAARPTARSSSTTSPSPATTPCWSSATASSSSRTRAR